LTLSTLGALILCALAIAACGSTQHCAVNVPLASPARPAQSVERSESTGRPPTESQVADEPITIDFIRNDIHVGLHRIALRFGLNFTIEGDVEPDFALPMPNFSTDGSLARRQLIAWLKSDPSLNVVAHDDFVYIKKANAVREDLSEQEFRSQRGAFERHPDLPVMPRPIECHPH